MYIYKDRRQISDYLGLGGGGNGQWLLMGTEFLLGMMKML